MLQFSWRYRRAAVFGTLAFCAGALVYLIGWGDDTRLHQDIANGLLLLAGSVVGSYVFGAVWQDRGVAAAVAPPRDDEEYR